MPSLGQELCARITFAGDPNYQDFATVTAGKAIALGLLNRDFYLASSGLGKALANAQLRRVEIDCKAYVRGKACVDLKKFTVAFNGRIVAHGHSLAEFLKISHAGKGVVGTSILQRIVQACGKVRGYSWVNVDLLRITQVRVKVFGNGHSCNSFNLGLGMQTKAIGHSSKYSRLNELLGVKSRVRGSANYQGLLGIGHAYKAKARVNSKAKARFNSLLFGLGVPITFIEQAEPMLTIDFKL